MFLFRVSRIAQTHKCSQPTCRFSRTLTYVCSNITGLLVPRQRHRWRKFFLWCLRRNSACVQIVQNGRETNARQSKNQRTKTIVKVWKERTALILLIVLLSDFLLFVVRRHFLVVGVAAARTFNLCSLFFFCPRFLLLQTYETTIRRDTGANAHIVSLPPFLPFFSSSDAHHPSSPLWFYAFSQTHIHYTLTSLVNSPLSLRAYFLLPVV